MTEHAETSHTADPYGAQAHARAQGGTRVEAMPTLPASAALNTPHGVSPSSLVWDEIIAGGGYASKQINRGTRLQLTDLYGDACVSMLIFNSERPVERLNVADTLKIQWNGYLGQGKFILSDMGRVLMSILDDTAGTHDAFCGASNSSTNARKYGDGSNFGPYPSSRDRFAIATAKYGLGRKDIHPCINWFKGVKIERDGTTTAQIGPFDSGREITLRAEMDLILVLANTPHALDARPNYTISPVRATAWQDAITPHDDPIRTGTPEALRAFLNVEDYYAR
jgi:urea carboxylase-associated protein 2